MVKAVATLYDFVIVSYNSYSLNSRSDPVSRFSQGFQSNNYAFGFEYSYIVSYLNLKIIYENWVKKKVMNRKTSIYAPWVK